MACTTTTYTSTLSLAGVVVLFLLKAPPKITASSSCDWKPIFARVEKDSLNISYASRKIGERNWTLDAVVTWKKPHGANFNGYALQMMPIYATKYSDCEDYAITANQSYNFTDMIYGEHYELVITTAQIQAPFYTLSHFREKLTVWAPDCYEETGDREFCQHKSITTLSKIADVRLDCIIRDDIDPTFLTAYISWLPPIQVNGDLMKVEIRYWESKHDEEYQKLDLERSELRTREITKDELRGWPSLRYESEIRELAEGLHYTVQLKMYAGNVTDIKVENQPATFDFNTLNLTQDLVAQILEGTAVNDCYAAVNSTAIAYTVNTTISVQRSVAEQRLLSDEATLVVLIIMSILAVLTVVALILCYFRRRPITHLTKQGVFGRYPDEAGAPHKNSETEALRQKGRDTASRRGGHQGDVWQTVQSSLGVNIFYEPHTPPSQRENDPIFLAKEFNRSFLKIEDKLGSGQFGVVYKGFALGIDGTDKYQPVAVKSLKLDATDAMKADFLDEIKLIIEIGCHPNILAFLGCCTTEEPYYLITEFMKFGDLLRFLLRCREEIYQEQDCIYKVTKRGQLQIARQIARGMEYLSSTRYYHGDLAARNVLVGEGLVVKISDFGMADDIYQQGYKRLAPERKRPVKWVSLETNTRGQCTIQGDVWSFGIVLYEIYTFGDVPYPGLDGRDVVRTLMEGFRMDKPENCPNEIYEIMLQCWHENPYDRPSFTELYTRLDDMLSQSSDYICDLENNVRYHPDTSRTFRPSSSPIPIGNRPLPPDPFQVVMKGAPPSSYRENHQDNMPNRCREFEIDECTC